MSSEADEVSSLMLPGTDLLDQIKDQAENLQASMMIDIAALKDEWAQFRRDKELVDSEWHRINTYKANDLDRLKLNVGGRRFEIRQSCVMNNSFFKAMMSGTIGQADADGYFFIDRDGSYIQAIMNWYRGSRDFSQYTQKEIEKIRIDAEFLMALDLQQEIEEWKARMLERPFTLLSFNMARSFHTFFPGIFFELRVSHDCVWHSISFVTGERRMITAQLFYKEGSIDSSSTLKPIAEVEEQTDKSQLVKISFQPVPLEAGLHTMGIYSAYTVAVCPRSESHRDDYKHFTMERSYHATDIKGNFNKRSGDDQFDFCGEIIVSVEGS